MGSHQLSGATISYVCLETIAVTLAQIDSDTRPTALGPPFTGHFRILMDTPRGLQPLHPGPTAVRGNVAATLNGTGPSSNLELRKDIYRGTIGSKALDEASAEAIVQSVAKANEEDQVGYSYACDTCGVDCTRSRYHSTKQKDFEVCPNCYLEGRFPSSMYSGDFVRLDDQHFKQNAEATWSDQESLLLLEALELHDDNWDKIAEHVGSRTREQCVAHFLQLPIEDAYLSTAGTGAAGPLAYLGGRTEASAMGQVDNPVLSVVAFLASIVDPKVAAAAAQSAVETLKEEIKAKAAKVADDESAMKVEPKEVNGVDEASRASTAALGAAAAKAHLLASHEDGELLRLVREVVDAQVEKLNLKIKQVDELESLLEAERRAVEAQRQALVEDRLQFAKLNAAALEASRRLQADAAANASAPAELQALAALQASTSMPGYVSTAQPSASGPSFSGTPSYASLG